MLSQASMMGTRCPHWYFVTLELQERRNTGRAEAIFEEAIAKEPTYYPYYRLHALYQRQEWNADKGEAERFAQRMADQSGGKEGDIIYFEIASAMDVSPNVRLFPIADLSWDRVTRGYSALQEKYGFSLQKLNQLAYLAMRARKIEQAAELFSRIGNNWDAETWGSEKLFEYSKAYATAPQEIVSLRRQMHRYDTPQGQKYGDQVKHDLFSQLSASLQRCVERNPNQPYAGFEWFIQVNGDGAVQSARIWPENKFNTCMSADLHSSSLKVSAPENGQQLVRIGDFPSPSLLDE
jgi:hypothetical protein